jgi:hypothetical protein
MKPQLATNADKLFDKINQLRLADVIDEFTFARLQHEVEKLSKIDPFHAYLLRGALASLKHDLSGIRKNYQAALNLATKKEDKVMVLDNYAISMWMNGYFSEASTLAMESYKNFPSSHFVQQYILRLRAIGLFHQAADLIRKHPLNEQGNNDRFVFQVEQFMDQHDVSDESLQQLIGMAIAVLHRHEFFDFRHDWLQLEFVEDESEKCFCYTIKIKRLMAEVIDLNYELAREIAKSGLPTVLTLNFVLMYEVA